MVWGSPAIWRARAVEVVEVIRPNRQVRRRRGKSDTVDAEAAARAALSGDAACAPEGSDGIVESIRVLRVALCSTRAHRTRVANQIRDLITTAPDALRVGLEPLTTPQRVQRCALLRPGDLAQPAGGHQGRPAHSWPASTGCSTPTSPSCAATSTISPRPPTRRCAPPKASAPTPRRSCSSQPATPPQTPKRSLLRRAVRHLPRGGLLGQDHPPPPQHSGNRQANHALWRIAMVRLCTDASTRAYAPRRQTDGKTRRETIRCLKRYIAREVHRLLTNPQPGADTTHNLRELRQHAGATLQHAADELGTWPSTTSRIEHGKTPNHHLCPPTATGSTPKPPPLDLTQIGASVLGRS